MSLCKYKNILGKPGMGFHSYRIFGLAGYDILGTLLISLVIWYLSSYKVSFLVIFFGLWGFGIFLHYIFCVKTPITKFFL